MSDQSSGAPEPAGERLRPHPTPRFAAAQHQYDLSAVTARLRQELDANPNGPAHRQETLYKRGSSTIALFLLGPSTGLPAHRAQGVVMIQVLDGHVQVKAEGQIHNLTAGHLLVLAPAVEHDVIAQQPSRMLLTVHLDPAAANPAP